MYKSRRETTYPVFDSPEYGQRPSVGGGNAIQFSSAVIGSCLVSSQGFGERIVSRIYYGGRKAAYAAAVGAMIANNLNAPLYAATSTNKTVNAGQTSTVAAADTWNSTVISGTSVNYANLIVSGKASSTRISSFGRMYVDNGGSAVVASVYNNGSQVVAEGGFARGVVIYSGGKQYVNGGENSAAVISSGGILYVNEYGVNIRAIIRNGGVQYVYDDGSDHRIVISSGGTQNVQGGTAYNATVRRLGTQNVFSGGHAEYAEISSGGMQNVYSGGSADVAEISSGGVQSVYGGGIANLAIISGGGTQIVNSGGTAIRTKTSSGGFQIISSGGIASSATISSGGYQNVSSGGVDSNAIIMGYQNVYNGGSTVSGILKGYGNQIISSGGNAIGMEISGGYQFVYAGGTASGTKIKSGMQIIYGMASDTHINGGEQYIAYSGVASGVYIEKGLQTVADMGTAYSVSVGKYGSQIIYNGGSALNTYISDGGLTMVFGGGYVSGISAIDSAHIDLMGSSFLYGTTYISNASASIHGGGARIDNLVADKAVISINADLKNQTADMINIVSSFSGNAQIKVNNVGDGASKGTLEGIRIVHFYSGSVIHGTFSLYNDIIEEGPYAYKLEQGAHDSVTRDYFLRNTGYSDTFKGMMNVPAFNLAIVQAGMNSLQHRMGDLRNMDYDFPHNGMWGRTYYKSMTIDVLADADIKLTGAEAGYDWMATAGSPIRMYGGFMFGNINLSSLRTRAGANGYEDGNGKAPSIGAYFTAISENEWFTDLTVRNFWSKMDMASHTPEGIIRYKPERRITAISLEAGMDYGAYQTSSEFLRFSPKAELSYIYSGYGEAGIAGSTHKLSYSPAHYANVKFSAQFAYSFMNHTKGLLFSPFAEAGFRYEFAGDVKASYGTADAKTTMQGGTVELSGGINTQLSDETYVYIEGSYERSGKISGWGTQLGVRYKFKPENKVSEDQDFVLTPAKD